MHRTLVRSTFTVLVAVLAVLALGAAPAAARTTPFSFDYDGTFTAAPCGFDVQIRDVGTAHGRSSPDRFDITNAGVVTYTNLANNLSATDTYQVLFKNFNQVEDPETGFISGDQTVVGAGTLRGPDGRVLLRSHGPRTIHLVINPNATNEEDFIVSLEVVSEHGSHPSDEAYCQALTAAIGPGATA
jgi:hypothetical protein